MRQRVVSREHPAHIPEEPTGIRPRWRVQPSFLAQRFDDMVSGLRATTQEFVYFRTRSFFPRPFGESQYYFALLR